MQSRSNAALGPLEVQGDFSAKVLTATYDTVFGARSNAKVIADVLGLKERTVYAIAAGEMPLKVTHVPGMVSATGCFAIPDAIETALGRVAFALPTLPAHIEELNRELARNITAFGEFLKENGVALADAKILPHEAPPLLSALNHIIAGLCEYRVRLERKAAEDAAAA